MAAYVYDLDSSLALLVPAFAILVAVYFLLRKRFSFDAKFLSALLPFSVLGALVRSLTDKGILPYGGGPTELGYWTHTPGLWLLGGLATLALLVTLQYRFKDRTLGLLQKIGWITVAAIGLYLLFLRFPAQTDFLLVLFFAVIATALWMIVARVSRRRFLRDDLNTVAFASNALDGAASLVAFGLRDCIPKHELTGTLIGIHPLAFIAGKIVFILFLLLGIEFVFRRMHPDPQAEGLAKIFLVLFNVITGVRAWFFIGAGFCALA